MNRDNIKILVLHSGEQIIGEVTGMLTEEREVRSDALAKPVCYTEIISVIVEQPVSMFADPSPEARGRIVFIPYLQATTLTSCEFPGVNVRHVLGEVKDDLVNAYAQQFGNGLQIPSKKLVLA